MEPRPIMWFGTLNGAAVNGPLRPFSKLQQGPPMPHRHLKILPLLTLAMALLALAACDDEKKAASAPAPPPAVGVATAAMKGVSRADQFVGRIQAIGIVGVRARVEGFLEKVLFTEGQDVKAGDILYQIE